MKFLLTISLLLLLLFSCSSEDYTTKEELLGEWQTSDMFINGDDSEIPFNTNGLIIMGLEEDHYFYNFNSGAWKVNENKLILEKGDNIFREYIITFFDSDSLVIEKEIDETQLFFNIESLETNERFTLTEHFKRN